MIYIPQRVSLEICYVYDRNNYIYQLGDVAKIFIYKLQVNLSVD